jgi:hypothetical protein
LYITPPTYRNVKLIFNYHTTVVDIIQDLIWHVIWLYCNVKPLLTPDDGHVDWPKHVAWSTIKNTVVKEHNNLWWIIYITHIIIFMVIYNTTGMYCSNVNLSEEDLQHCFQQWKIHMEWCRDQGGVNIEGDNISIV